MLNSGQTAPSALGKTLAMKFQALAAPLLCAATLSAAAPYADSHPVYSPDGKLIAFESQRSGHLQAMIMNADGTGQRLLADHAFDSGYPRWFPDGRRLAFHARVQGEEWQVFTIRADGSDLRQISRGFAYIFEGTPSPDGSRMAMIGRRQDDPEGATHLYVLNVAGGNAVRLTSDPVRKYQPSWSPDGKRIAYGAQSPEGNFEIFTIDAKGGGLPRRITRNITVDSMQPSWSRDGTRIAHVCSDEQGRSLCVADLASGKVTEVEAARAVKPWRPDWSTNDGSLLFDGNRDGVLDVFTVDLATGRVRKLTSKPDSPFLERARRGNLEDALAAKDGNAGDLVRLTEELLASNDLDGALRVAQANVQQNPDVGTCQILGDVLRRQGKWAPASMHGFMTALRRDGAEAALTLYREGRSLYPGWLFFPTVSISRHGYHYLNAGDLPRAKAAFQMLVDSYPSSAWGYEGLARVFRAQGRPEAAGRAEERVRELDSAAPED
jgi:Tol biopolymer transport system component